MNAKDISTALNNIAPEMIADAACRKKRTLSWIAAACVTLAIAGGTLGILRPWELQRVNLGGMSRIYRNAMTSTETALIFPWEYMPVYERYNGMAFNGVFYRTRAKAISHALLTEALGVCQASGYDIYTNKTITEEFPVYGIRGVDSMQLVAVELEGVCYVYLQDEYAPQMTLGALIETFSLAETLQLQRYTTSVDHQTKFWTLETAEDNRVIWEVLTRCADAPYFEEDPWYQTPAGTISFTATSETLGIYKKAFQISPDGYLHTNIMEYGYTYYIGTEAAAEIIAYVQTHSSPTEMEPYEYRLAGIVTEIGEGYLLLNDEVVAFGGKGMVFRVPTEKQIISRWLEFGGIGVGDLIVVSYTGGISQDGTNTVCEPTSLARGFLSDGAVLVPE